jgi:hypothetical protein
VSKYDWAPDSLLYIDVRADTSIDMLLNTSRTFVTAVQSGGHDVNNDVAF